MEGIANIRDFEEKVLDSDVPVMVEFSASWCTPCQLYAPVIRDIAKEVEGRAKVFLVDAEESMDIAKACRVRSVPTVVFFEGGGVKDYAIGLQQKEYLVELLFAKPLEYESEKV